jgi:hypothetical protein
MPSRRTLLSAVASGGLAGLAGCSGSGGTGQSPVSSCAASFGERETGDLFAVTGPDVEPEEGSVRLLVALPAPAIRETGVVRVQFRRSDGAVAHELPVSPDGGQPPRQGRYPADDVRVFQTTVGPLPQAGRYRVVALDEAGETVDALTMTFECFVERPER